MYSELFGWVGIWLGFASGAVLGLFFRDEHWLGGYASWRRRLLRLGHIALIALGALNLLAAQSIPRLDFDAPGRGIAAGSFVLGGFLMPLACFLTAWRRGFYFAFIPAVALLLTGATVMLLAALRSLGR